MQPAEFTELLKSRYSVRDFHPDPIPEQLLADILDDARWAPSWSNTRGYLLAVASGDQLERLRSAHLAEFDASLGMYHREPSAFVKAALTGRLPDGDFKTWGRYPDDLRPRSVRVGVGLYQQLGIERGDRAGRDAWSRRNCEFFGAPTVIWVFAHGGLLPFSAQDAGLMMQTLMLSATAHGVGSCALGVLATWRRLIDAEFDIPRPYKLLTGLALGYPSDAEVNQFRAEHPAVSLATSKH